MFLMIFPKFSRKLKIIFFSSKFAISNPVVGVCQRNLRGWNLAFKKAAQIFVVFKI